MQSEHIHEIPEAPGKERRIMLPQAATLLQQIIGRHNRASISARYLLWGLLALSLLCAGCTAQASTPVAPPAAAATVTATSVQAVLPSQPPAESTPTWLPSSTPPMEAAKLPTLTPSQAVLPSPENTLAETPTATAALTVTAPLEQPVIEIPLAGPAANESAEISGMEWYGDYLILLPQYPRRMSRENDGALFALPRQQILDFLDGKISGPLEPQVVPFVTGGFEKNIKNFDGFEAIAFQGNQVFCTIEAKSDDEMMGYIVSGQIAPDLSRVFLNPATLTRNEPQVQSFNRSDETLVVVGKRLFSVFEVNGKQINPQPVIHQFDFSLEPLGTLSFPNIEYRITDATSLDKNGRFWAINAFFPSDLELLTADDPLANQYGVGQSQALLPTVERLVEFQLSHNGIVLSDRPPIYLQLLPFGNPRNWEGLARLDQRGFLLATDKFPTTILAFVPYPEQ